MDKLRKALIISVSVITVLSMSMLAVPFQASAAASAGDLIKMDGLSSVYYLGADGKRYVFPNESTYFSWYSDFSNVVTIPQAELESYPLGANVVMRPGTKLIKITTDPKVYAVEPNGVLRHIPDEATALSLYGENWAKRVVDVADAFFTNYTIGDPLTDQYPAGSLIKLPDASDVYYIDTDGKARKFASEAAFTGNRFKWDDIITTATDYTLPELGDDITGVEDALTDTSQGGGGSGIAPESGTGLTVALSGTTAPSNTLIVGQANANLASFTVTASSDGDVKITSFKVKRTGISSDSTLDSVYLYNGDTRLTDNASVSSGYVSWNNSAGIITVPAGTSVTLTVKADMAGSSGETVGVSLEAASDISAGGAVVSGSFPINGNLMSLASATLASVAFGSPTPAAGTVDAGEDDFVAWKSQTSIGTRAVYLKSIRLRQIGSISDGDLENFRFYVDGVEKATAEMDGTYLNFNFDTPVKLETGTRNLELRVNVIDGATRTFSFSVQYAVDVVVSDSEYGADIQATGIPATSGSQTINSGSLTVTKLAGSPSGNVTKDASGVVLAKYELKAYGEKIKVEYIRISVDSSDNSVAELQNGALFVDGVQIGSTKDLAETDNSPAYTDFSLGSSLVVEPGTPVVVEVRADIYDSDGTNDISSGDTLTVTMETYTNAAQRMSSLSYFDAPTTDVDGNTLTVAVGSLTLAKKSSYGNQTVVLPQSSAYKLAEFVLSGNSTEAVNVNTYSVSWTASGTFSAADLSDVYLMFNDTPSTVKSTVSGTTTWSVSQTLGISETMVVGVYAVIGSDVSNIDAITTNMQVSGITADSSESVTSTYAIGQTITKGTGSITSSLAASSPVSSLVKGGTTIDAASFKFTTVNDAYKITEVIVKVGSAGATAIDHVELYDDTTELGTAYISGTTATFSGLEVNIDANDNKTLTVKLALGEIGDSAGTTGADVKVTLDSFKAENSQGSESTDTTDRAGNSIYVYKSVPTIATQAMPSTTLTAGTVTLAKFTVSGDGIISWKRFLFTVLKDSDTVVTSPKLYDANTNEEITGTGTTTSSLLDGDTSGTITFTATNEQEISGSKTYVLKATISGTVATGDYVSTSLAQPSSYASPAAYASVSGSPSFVWSDEAANSHSETTSDWNNDYLVKNLPTDSQTLEK